MDKKIILTLVSLLAVALIIVAVVMVAGSGGVLSKSGGFTALMNDMTYDGDLTYQQYLECPSSWTPGDSKTVRDVIVDMRTERERVGVDTWFYTTDLWFVYVGDKWNDPDHGTLFYVPDNIGDDWLVVSHGQFMVTVTTATNLAEKYDVGDSITLQTALVTNDNGLVAFGTWTVKDTL
jgi:hypothetical protein